MTHFSTWGTLRRASMLNVAPQDGAGGWWWWWMGGVGGGGGRGGDQGGSIFQALGPRCFFKYTFSSPCFSSFLLSASFSSPPDHEAERLENLPRFFFFSLLLPSPDTHGVLPRLHGDGGGVGTCVGGREREEVSADLARVLSPRCSRRSVPRFF